MENIIEKTIQYINSDDTSEEAFNEQALTLFRFQYEHNIAYQHFCRQQGKTIRRVQHWTEIPVVPVDAFKQLPLTCTKVDDAVATFMTSGSTSGIRGKHYHPTLKVYDQSMTKSFKQFVMQDFEKIRMAIIFPTKNTLPNSSLAHYLSVAKNTFGTRESDYYIDEKGIAYERLFAMLSEVIEREEPLLLLGASYSFVHLFEKMKDQSFPLPKGSIIFDTGGYKNKSKNLKLDDFYNLLQKKFHVPRRRCLNMYGMTELSTQFYDAGNEELPSLKMGPHWIKSRVVDPLTMNDQQLGEEGVLLHYDLANINSVLAIMTEDIGIKYESGFHLLGRAEGTAAEGCSLALDEFIQVTEGLSK